jgi:two-component system sensor kinase FixL
MDRMPAIPSTNHLRTEFSGEASPPSMGLGTQTHPQTTDLRVAASLCEVSGIIAHEITQPLTAILIDAESALRLLGDNAPARDVLQDIIASVLRATEIVKRLRLMMQGAEPTREECFLNEIVVSALRIVAPEIATRSIEVQLNLDEDLDWISVDRVQIEQVIVNLLVNACEAMESTPQGQRVLRITSGCSADRSRIELAVGDTGSGVAAGAHERIFQPFVTTKSHGLGLGLAICRLITHAHGGHLWSEVAERGALFRMRLPARRP